ncbi:MAG: hypothetical protein EOP84_15320 [Verrucomicrobiaceae bacterium]|nr:MAG: hypothetical protein EOP84_15320 [Verrucomicrobiaceae bacterium]
MVFSEKPLFREERETVLPLGETGRLWSAVGSCDRVSGAPHRLRKGAKVVGKAGWDVRYLKRCGCQIAGRVASRSCAMQT